MILKGKRTLPTLRVPCMKPGLSIAPVMKKNKRKVVIGIKLLSLTSPYKLPE